MKRSTCHIPHFFGFAYLLGYVILASPTAQSAIIPANRTAQWSSAGIAGGVPTRTTIYTTLAPGSSAATISAALRSCPANQVVKLSAGNYVLSGSIDWQGVQDGVVLRGAGSDPQTGTHIVSTGFPIINMRNFFSESALGVDVNLSADAKSGDTTLTVGSVPSWIVVGKCYGIDQLNDEILDTEKTGRESAGTYRERASAGSNGPRGRGESFRVVAKTATTVTLEFPLISPYTTSQTAQIFGLGYDAANYSMRKNCGIEDLYLEGGASQGDTNTISMETCDGCWVKNVYSYKVPGKVHVIMEFCYGCEVRDSYFYDSFLWNAGQGYGVALYDLSCYNKIENNILRKLHVSLQANYGSSGNVFGYNYVGLENMSDANEEPGFDVHGNSAQFNLFEGNFNQAKAMFDCIHGSNSTNTLFRNRIVGHIAGKTDNQCAVDVDHWNKNCNIVGNILGDSSWHTIRSKTAPTSGTSIERTVIKYGYVNAYGCDATSYTAIGTLNLIEHGNYDTVSNSVVWDATITDHTIPSSLYLASKPAFFGNLNWPAYDPTTYSTSSVTSIPAGYRFVNGTPPPGVGTPTAPTSPVTHMSLQ